MDSRLQDGNNVLQITRISNFSLSNRQPSGHQCGSICNSDTSAFFAWRKPSGDCLDGWGIRRINRMEGDGIWHEGEIVHSRYSFRFEFHHETDIRPGSQLLLWQQAICALRIYHWGHEAVEPVPIIPPDLLWKSWPLVIRLRVDGQMVACSN